MVIPRRGNRELQYGENDERKYRENEGQDAMRGRIGADRPESEVGGKRGAGSALRRLHVVRKRHQVSSGKHGINEGKMRRRGSVQNENTIL
jgi:hypothetical protein